MDPKVQAAASSTATATPEPKPPAPAPPKAEVSPAPESAAPKDIGYRMCGMSVACSDGSDRVS